MSTLTLQPQCLAGFVLTEIRVQTHADIWIFEGVEVATHRSTGRADDEPWSCTHRATGIAIAHGTSPQAALFLACERLRDRRAEFEAKISAFPALNLAA